MDTKSPPTDAPAASPANEPRSWRGLLYVTIAVIFFGTSPIFIRWSAPFNAVEIAFWRLTIASALMALMGLVTRQYLLLKRQQIARFAFYGLITALHFIFYIAALQYTTIAHTLAIIYTSPILVTLFSVIFLREPLAIRKYIGIGVTTIGIAILVGFEPGYTACSLSGEGSCMILGDSLALLSGLCFAIYSVAGRGERDRHPLFRYTLNVYGCAALWLLPLALYFSFGHPYPLAAVGAVIALGVFPLGLGHTLYNASVRRIHATYASLISTQEVTIGVILGIVLLHEMPSASAIVGGLVMLLGIAGVLL